MDLIKITIISTGDVIYIHGIRSISSYMKKHGCNTQLIFLPTHDKKFSDETLRELKNLVHKSDLIGISCTSYTSDKAIQVIKHLQNLKIPIVWGGIHATFNPEECLKYADFVCIGEGEETMLELVEKLSKKMDVTKIKNLWVKKGCKIYKNDVRPLIQNLDELPFEDYDFETQWVLDDSRLVRMNEKHFRDIKFHNKLHFNVSSVILVHTTRGCPYSCTYCCNSGLRKIYLNKGNFVRKRSIKNIIEELVELRQKFPSINFVWFTDDTFFIRSIEEMTLFCKEYKKKIALPFMCYVDPLTFNETKLKLLLDAGLKRTQMGIQTGSEEVNRNIYGRFITNKHIINISKIFNKYTNKGFIPEYQLIIANPYETEKDMLATINLLQQLPKLYYLQPFALVFFPGTQLFYKAMNDGIIISKIESCYNISYGNYTKHFMFKSKKLDTLYLNLILTLLNGMATSSRYGLLPKQLLKLLLNKKIVRFFNKFKFLTKILIKVSLV